MGKASKWFRGLLGQRTPDSSSSSPKPPKEKRRWSFVKSYREKENHLATTVEGGDKRAALTERAIAAATAALAEARVTGIAATGVTAREEWAAVTIQAAFRGCLARKALRALKGLVKLQALVRGHIERKRTKEWAQRVQALLRAQARAHVARAQILEQALYWSSAKSSSGPLYGPATPEKFESPTSSESLKYGQSSSALKRSSSKSCSRINGNQEKSGTRSDNQVDGLQSWTQRRSWMRTCSMDDETSFRILDTDSRKPHIRTKRRNLFYSSCSQPLLPDQYSQSLTATKDSTSYQTVQSPSSCEVMKTNEAEENSYQEVLSASSKDGGAKRSPLTTPTKSDGSRSYLSGYNADYYPSYMAYTESSKAKLRSLSAPKQRPPQYERSSSANRYAVHRFGESKLATQRIATLRASFTSKAYPGSGRLDKLGLPIGYSY